MAKKIAVKDFDHFVDHTGMTGASEAVENSHMLVTNTLVALRGNKWRDMRATLSPAFTGSKMRQMFTLIAEWPKPWWSFIRTKNPDAGFGLKVDSFKEQRITSFTLGKSVSQPTGVLPALKMLGYTLAPRLMVKMNVDFLSREQDRFFRGVVRDTMKTRQEQNIYRPDMIELLMQAKKGSLKHQTILGRSACSVEGVLPPSKNPKFGLRNHDRVWTDDELAAQAFIFFFAGFETVSITLSLFSYELTKNADIQAKLYQEILATEQQLNGQPLTYETLQTHEVPGHGHVGSTPGVAHRGTIVDRCCIKDLRVSTTVRVAVLSEPGQVRPRNGSSDENRAQHQTEARICRSGIGPRNCIGSRFALMELKTIIYYLLLNFSFEVHEKTQIPLRMEKSPNRGRTKN
ncbi:hypothetical protein quinque_007009 [Culex quinquefasciatus]